MNYKAVGHVIVGVIIAGSQALALAAPSPSVVSACHIVAIVAAQVGVSLGIWQATSPAAISVSAPGAVKIEQKPVTP